MFTATGIILLAIAALSMLFVASAQGKHNTTNIPLTIISVSGMGFAVILVIMRALGVE